MLGQSGLRQVQAPGRAGQISLMRDFAEIAQMMIVEISHIFTKQNDIVKTMNFLKQSGDVT